MYQEKREKGAGQQEAVELILLMQFESLPYQWLLTLFGPKIIQASAGA